MRKEVLFGIIAALGLLVLYTALLYALNGPEHTLEQFRKFGVFIVLLAAGFGVQTGLFLFARTELKNRLSAAQFAATGSVSGGSMIACCLHHATDVLPLVGLSGLALFATEYTLFFLVLGVLSNLVGIAFMLSMLQKHNAFPFARMSAFNWTEIRNLAAVLSVIVLVAAVGYSFFLAPRLVPPLGAGAFSLSPQINSQNNVEVSVTPQISESQTAFEIQFTTHSGSLDFEVEDIATLQDETGAVYPAVAWEGSPPGGHHRSGKLVFGPLPENARRIRLVLLQVSQSDRSFEWNLSP